MTQFSHEPVSREPVSLGKFESRAVAPYDGSRRPVGSGKFESLSHEWRVGLGKFGHLGTTIWAPFGF